MSYLSLRQSFLFCLFLCLMPGPAQAADFRVNSAYDVRDLTPGNGLCVAYLFIFPPFVLPYCTLRGAIEETNSLAGADTIRLPSGVIALSRSGRDENDAATGDLDITESLTIIGQGAGITFIDADGIDRVFDVLGENVTLTLQNLTLINGLVDGTAAMDDRGGGAVRNAARLVLKGVVLQNHGATGESEADVGGILLNQGDCDISFSTLEGGQGFEGGAIFNDVNGQITLISSTLNSNQAKHGAGVSNYGYLEITNATVSTNGSKATRYGGGVENWGVIEIQQTTVAGNRASRGGGISNRGAVFVQNSIIGNNSGGDCNLPRYIFSDGYNIDSDNSCGLYQESDLIAVDPKLQTLHNYGGATRTHALFPESPAIDSGFFVEQADVDQRGMPRPQGTASDRGAVESIRFPMLPLIYPLLSPIINPKP